MSNERKLRLIQVAKEFKVGLNTITDFLQKKGIKTDGSPNTLVEPDVYAVLEKEFGGSRITGNERESIRERISQKQATITLEEAQKQTREEEQEVIIKSNVISVKDDGQRYTFACIGESQLSASMTSEHIFFNFNQLSCKGTICFSLYKTAYKKKNPATS